MSRPPKRSTISATARPSRPASVTSAAIAIVRSPIRSPRVGPPRGRGRGSRPSAPRACISLAVSNPIPRRRAGDERDLPGPGIHERHAPILRRVGRLAPCGCSRSPTSATPAPGCSRRRSPPPAARLDHWQIAEAAEPARRPARLRRGDDLRRRDARRPGRPPRLDASRRRSCSPSCSMRGTPLLGVCLGSQLLVEAAGGEARRAPRARDRLVRRRADRARAPTTRCWRRWRPAFEAFQWHSYESAPPPGADDARPQPGLRAGVPGRRARLGDPVPRRGQRRPTRAHWIDDYRVRPRRGPDRARPGRPRARDRDEDRGLERARPRALRPLPGRGRRATAPAVVVRSYSPVSGVR